MAESRLLVSGRSQKIHKMLASTLATLLPLTAAFSPGASPLALSRPAAVAAPAPLFMSQPTKEKTSIFDKMRGVVVKTDAPAQVEEEEDSKSMMQKVKDAGVAGIISYIFWEWAFWGVSVPVSLFGFQAATGHWPDFQNQEVRAPKPKPGGSPVPRARHPLEAAPLCMLTRGTSVLRRTSPSSVQRPLHSSMSHALPSRCASASRLGRRRGCSRPSSTNSRRRMIRFSWQHARGPSPGCPLSHLC